MSQQTGPQVKESALHTNLNELANTFVRELAMAGRKMAIYGSDHPQSQRSIEKPFLALSDLFRFKTIITLNVHIGQLYVANIRLKESVFGSQILQYLQGLDISALLFERRVTIDEFGVFLQGLIRRESAHDTSSQLAALLQRQGIESIQVNTERAYELLERRKQYRGDVESDFSVRRFVLDQIGSELNLMANLSTAEIEQLLEYNIDFEPGVVRYLLPEAIAKVPAEQVRSYLKKQATTIRTAQLSGSGRIDTARYMTVFQLVSMHPDREKIVADLDKSDMPAAQAEFDPNSATGKIKLESTRRVESALEEVFADASDPAAVADFASSFSRLLKTGQKSKATDTINKLLDQMSDADSGHRQRALNVILAALPEFKCDADLSVMRDTVKNVAGRLDRCEETFEYSEFLWHLFDVCHDCNRLNLMADLTTAMAKRRRVMDNVTVYDSIAIKKAFENISRGETIDRLIKDLIRANHEQANSLKTVLTNIGTESVALALSKIISHPVRAIRQVTLRILADMGKAALNVFSGMLQHDALFERESGRRELPDEQWYVIRNSIFVLGSLHDTGGVPALRVRIADTDVRVRREIVAALEKIGGEDAVDCLTVMADDPDDEIRQASIIAIGLTGNSGDAPVLIDLARRHAADSIRVAVALGKLGGAEARQFLAELITDQNKLNELTGGKVSKDELRLAVVKALGVIGDKDSIAAIRQLKEQQSAASKLFFKNSSLNKTIDEILARS